MSGSSEECVVVVGLFDGVHGGHRTLLANAFEIARAASPELPVHVLTFDPHPRSVLTDDGPGMLGSVLDRTRLLKAAGVAHVHVQTFDQSFAALSPLQFARDVVAEQLRAQHVVVGTNFRFGAGAAGDVEELRRLGENHGFAVTGVALQGDADGVVSSSRIRALLGTGEVGAASELLGHDYELDGIVVHGAKRGRELGFPTANLRWDGARLVPADGVYGGIATVDGERWVAAISVGTNPQFDPGGTSPRSVEAYLLDFPGGDILYDLHLTLAFHARVRAQATFPDLDAFIARMHVDVDEVRSAVSLG